jgi:ATP-dependent helicase/DNAse subunit B
MAVHLWQRFARGGLLVRPGLIQPLSGFVRPWVTDLSLAPRAALHVLVAQAAERLPHKEFCGATSSPGLRAALVRLLLEFSSCGCDSRRLRAVLKKVAPDAPFAAVFQALFQEVERELGVRGWALRAGLLRKAAEEIRETGLGGIRRILIDGFVLFRKPELELIDALQANAEVAVTLPAWAGSEAAREALTRMGFTERPSGERAAPACAVVAFTAPDIEREAREVARRILETVAAGRRFSEIGVVPAEPDKYLPVLRSVFDRLGIPARLEFDKPLVDHPAVRFLSRIAEAMLGGWEHGATVSALTMAVSGAGATDAGDRFALAVRQRLPGSGLAELQGLTEDGRISALLDRLSAIDSWRAFRLAPPKWAARAQTLRFLAPSPPLPEHGQRELAALWRSRVAALDGFAAAMEETAACLPPEPIPFAKFWRAAAIVLEDRRFREPDLRHDAVRVASAWEARHWNLPVVFACGLGQETRRPESAILRDRARLELRRAGLELETSAEEAREEQLLLELAISGATSQAALSYPEYGAEGGPNPPSELFEKFAAGSAERSRPGAAAQLRGGQSGDVVRAGSGVPSTAEGVPCT